MIPELERLSRGIEHLQAVRDLFFEMEDDGERERAWRYLSSRFGEYENSEVPAWEQVQNERDEADAEAGKQAGQ